MLFIFKLKYLERLQSVTSNMLPVNVCNVSSTSHYINQVSKYLTSYLLDANTIYLVGFDAIAVAEVLVRFASIHLRANKLKKNALLISMLQFIWRMRTYIGLQLNVFY